MIAAYSIGFGYMLGADSTNTNAEITKIIPNLYVLIPILFVSL